MKEKYILRDYKFRKYLKRIGMNRRIFRELSYAAKSKIVAAYIDVYHELEK